MKEVKIDLREMNRWFRERFPEAELITFNELFSDYERLIFENEHLKEEFEEYKDFVKDNFTQND